jgi:CIC family chloride channel protein
MIELTGTYDFMLPLLVGCFVAYGIAEAMGEKPLYVSLRDRSARLEPPGISASA